ncbi:pirin family protein [Marinomonas mediterranea]|uniref:pirin family protein n=1 Tax=Marinomonas mediterranea TaxID=119864 RepID=UPI0023499C55|nr:pirin family protein [Marinomonas mediterranea]WCN10483.1 pirin family protein [Marinomonas mediterranea]WCN14531.1 pirin family protein [Marinomonas mediterranea]
MITLRNANDRGHANFGWLDSYHTFSFGSYYDPAHMGFSHLRVINDDTVAPSAGFDTHGHRDMEIISLVTQGRIAHKDSVGNIKELPKGEYQLMSAGAGIYHSEFNAKDDETLKFLQIWIQPNKQGGKPGYQQKAFGEDAGITPIITPTGEHGTLAIKQDMQLMQVILEKGQTETVNANSERRYYVHQIEGELTLNNGTKLRPGDGAMIQSEDTLTLQNDQDQRVKAILFDLV